jgi:uncharacterized protein (DUF2062 family)
MLDWRDRLRRRFYDLRLEGEGRGREAAALGLGLFIGCTPFYGFHLLLCWLAGRLLRLNRLKLYLAANISNPLFSPVLVFSEIQAGAWLRRGDFHDLTLAAIRATDPWTFGVDLLLGSAAIGLALGASLAIATWLTSGRRDEAFTALSRRASDPYLLAGISAWEFARGKLRGDPVYRALLEPDALSAGGTLVDVGCGGGLALSLIREASRDPACNPGGRLRFDRLVGIELRPRAAKVARLALGEDAEVLTADARESALPRCRTLLLLDVLHMLDAPAQQQLLDAAAEALEPGGTLVVREADAAGGMGFAWVRVGNRLKALVTGNWSQRFCFRSVAGWRALLESSGFRVAVRPASTGTPFANLLLVAHREAGAPPLHVAAEAHERGDRPVARVERSAEPQPARRF